MQNIWVIEDDENVARSLLDGLRQEGYDVRWIRTATEALQASVQGVPDGALLDLGLPDQDGFVVLEVLARNHPTLPVIILTARDEIPSRVRGLENGAVDYMVKPFAFPELLARLRLRLRENVSPETSILFAGGLSVDILRRSVRLGELPLELPPREFDLLACLLRAKGRPVSREEIAKEVWKSPRRMSSLDNLIDVHVSRLRERLSGPSAPVLRTLRGLGYVLEENS